MSEQRHIKPARLGRLCTAAAAATAVALLVSSASAASLRASDRASLHYVSSTVSVLYETGKATGTLPGSMRVHMRLGPKFSGSFTIAASGGTISGKGIATPHGKGLYESFAGTLTITGGTGRYRGAHGHGHLYGTYDRRSFVLKIETTGTLYY